MSVHTSGTGCQDGHVPLLFMLFAVQAGLMRKESSTYLGTYKYYMVVGDLLHNFSHPPRTNLWLNHVIVEEHSVDTY